MPFGGFVPTFPSVFPFAAGMPLAAPLGAALSPFGFANPAVNRFVAMKQRRRQQDVRNRLNLVTRPYDPNFDNLGAFPLGYSSMPLGLGLYDNSFDNVNVVVGPGALGASVSPLATNMLGVASVDNVGLGSVDNIGFNSVDNIGVSVDNLNDRRFDVNDATVVAGNGMTVL